MDQIDIDTSYLFNLFLCIHTEYTSIIKHKNGTKSGIIERVK